MSESVSGSALAPLVEALRAVTAGRDLDEERTAAAIGAIIDGHAGPATTAALLVALRMKGETEAEIAGAARALREKMRRVPVPPGMAVIDTCGTGGDGLHTFNVSTAAAFVVAGAGLPVAKHGNRSVSSRSGSADVLEALGIPLESDPARLGEQLERIGLAFLHAPHLHPAMRHAAPVRREIGVRTIFNLVGPLANPAGVRRQLLGVFDARLIDTLARVLGRLGSESVWVVHGHGGMDELTTTGVNRIAILEEGRVREEHLDPMDLGLPRAGQDDLAGGSPSDNALRIEEVLAGRRGPARDIVLLNAAAALVVGGKAPNVHDGLQAAAASIDSGRARGVLHRLRAPAT